MEITFSKVNNRRIIIIHDQSKYIYELRLQTHSLITVAHILLFKFLEHIGHELYTIYFALMALNLAKHFIYYSSNITDLDNFTT